jgi:hypothetical protein
VYSDTVANTIKDGLSPNFERLNKTFDTYGPLNVTEIGSGFIYFGNQALVIQINNYGREYGTDNDPSQYSASIASGLLDSDAGKSLQQLITEGRIDGSVAYINTTTKGGANSDVKRDGNDNVIPYVDALQGSGLSSSVYNIQYDFGNVTITPATLTVQANASREYGDPNISAVSNINYTGFRNNDDATDITGLAIDFGSINETTPAGNYSITSAGGTANNYDINHVAGIFTINKADLNVFVGSTNIVYGDDISSIDVPLTVGVGQLKLDQDLINDLGLIVSGLPSSTSPVGIYNVSVSFPTDPNSTANNYNIDISGIGKIMVDPATLTITAKNLSKTFGEDLDPSNFDKSFASYSGFKNGQDENIVENLKFSLQNTDQFSNVNVYVDEIIASGATAPNYAINFVAGDLTINAAELTIQADDKSREYGDLNPVFTANVDGFVNGEDPNTFITGLVFSTNANVLSPVGNYDIDVTGGNLLNSNYVIANYESGTLEVEPAILNVVVDNKTKEYGDPRPVFTNTVHPDDLKNGDTLVDIGGTIVYKSVDDNGDPINEFTNVGTYNISASGLGGGSVANNYNIVYTVGELEVSPATITVDIDDANRPYRQANPKFTATFSGFKNGEDENIINKDNLFLTSTATTSSPISGPTYPITGSGAVASNYTFTYNEGVLTITPAILTITANDKSRPINQDNPPFTATMTGFVDGDDESIMSGLKFNTNATRSFSEGNYAITPFGAMVASNNYVVDYVDGTLTITGKEANVDTIADATWRDYGYVGDSIQRTQPDPVIERGLTNDTWSPNDDVWQPWEQNDRTPLAINDNINSSILADITGELEAALRESDNLYRPARMGISDAKLFANNDTVYAQASSCWLAIEAWLSQRPFMDAMAKPSDGSCNATMSYLSSVMPSITSDTAYATIKDINPNIQTAITPAPTINLLQPQYYNYNPYVNVPQYKYSGNRYEDVVGSGKY